MTVSYIPIVEMQENPEVNIKNIFPTDALTEETDVPTKKSEKNTLKNLSLMNLKKRYLINVQSIILLKE